MPPEYEGTCQFLYGYGYNEGVFCLAKVEMSFMYQFQCMLFDVLFAAGHSYSYRHAVNRTG